MARRSGVSALRATVRADLTEDAHNALVLFLEANDITLTAVMEILAQDLIAELQAVDDPSHAWPDRVARARRLDAERRRRPRS